LEIFREFFLKKKIGENFLTGEPLMAGEGGVGGGGSNETLRNTLGRKGAGWRFFFDLIW
jgi:hypothetical protein